MKGTRELIIEILERGFLMSLATVDESGPWVSDVIYVYDDDLIIYWLSDIGRRHSKAIGGNPKTAATITLDADKNIGLQIEGKSKKIEGDVFGMAIKHRLKRKQPAPKKEGEILGPNESWYCLKPTKIEVIYGPLYGYDKRVLELK